MNRGREVTVLNSFCDSRYGGGNEVPAGIHRNAHFANPVYAVNEHLARSLETRDPHLNSEQV